MGIIGAAAKGASAGLGDSNTMHNGKGGGKDKTHKEKKHNLFKAAGSKITQCGTRLTELRCTTTSVEAAAGKELEPGRGKKLSGKTSGLGCHVLEYCTYGFACY